MLIAVLVVVLSAGLLGLYVYHNGGGTDPNITELQTINNRLQKESSQQKKRMEELETQLTEAQTELQKAREQSSLLGNQLKELEKTSIRQEESLRIANESLAAYEKENNRTQKRLKAQRNLAYGIGTVLLAALVRK